MNENEKTTIAMEFVDEEQDENKTTELAKVEEDKPKAPFGKFVDWVTTPARYLYNKARKSPVIAGLGGAVLGAAGGWGAKAIYDNVKRKKGVDFIPADPIEIPDDAEESHVDVGSSYESTEN